ncbi:hypothetical protein DVH24_017199 [Malus domestica]|uniref:Uncharacterized protein n=1 Tax=Malus domestica TaxID=3750 RepID=A0A498IS35_MALDO|nr:hypothetical protein DVH24_017199 [Malus domestica]
MHLNLYFPVHGKCERTNSGEFVVVGARTPLNSNPGNMRENRFRWFGHVQRRPTDAPVRKCDYGTEVQGRRGRGRPRKTLEETLRKDLSTWI